jgi:hypothetical protein
VSLIDLTGQVFGRLTVIGRAPTSASGDTRWHCRCECGNETTGRAGHLRRGASQSCGCMVREAARRRLVDLRGQVFGRLTVVERAENSAGGQTRWHCRCECGASTVVQGSSLRDSQSRSCGCLQRELTSERHLADLRGQRFGRLTVIERAGAGRVRWHCKCECGGDTTVSADGLRGGHTASCGCLRAEVAAELHFIHGHARVGGESATYRTWRAMLERTTNPGAQYYHLYGGRGITVDPRWEDFAEFLTDMGERPAGTTLDRVDNSRGYSADNCRWATAAEQAQNSRTAKLNWASVGEIRWLYAAGGITQRELSVMYGVSETTIRNVVNGRTWIDVPVPAAGAQAAA